MNIIKRVANAYKSGGFLEVVRKSCFHLIYSVNGIIVRSQIIHSELNYGLYQGEDRKKKVIVSLTSYPKRFYSIGLCLKSLLVQSVKPDRIIVYLGSDTKVTDITDEMREYEKYGIEYRIDETRNLRSHKKYFYAMQEFPNDIIITADDDVIYPVNLVKSLLESYSKYPNAISARRVHLMRIKNDKLMPYNQWFDQYRSIKMPSYSLIGTGNAGILYPPNCLDQRAFDTESLLSLCLNADDIWLKFMAQLKGTPVVWVPNFAVDPASVEEEQTESLSSENVFNSKNDECLAAMIRAYDIDIKDFFRG